MSTLETELIKLAIEHVKSHGGFIDIDGKFLVYNDRNAGIKIEIS